MDPVWMDPVWMDPVWMDQAGTNSRHGPTQRGTESAEPHRFGGLPVSCAALAMAR